MEWELFAQTWIPVFVILLIVTFGLIKFAAYRSKYKISQMNATKKIQKEKDTFQGAIGNIIDSAPAQLAQIESELHTIRMEAAKNQITPEQLKSLTQRLESERDMLKLAAKYGGIVKPIAKPLGAIFEKIVGGIGQ